MSDDYPDHDFPWGFYFNGEIMPKWGACWGMAGIEGFLQRERVSDQALGDRDVYIIYSRIDHVGVIESADHHVFIYAVQEVLQILLRNRDTILASFSDCSPEVYHGLVDAAFRMRELASQQRRAFWTSGYEADRITMLDAMRRCQLSPDSPEFMLPPHVHHLQRALKSENVAQVRRLHQLAQCGELKKDTRRRLLEIRAAGHSASVNL
jgi:hypothetical protein